MSKSTDTIKLCRDGDSQWRLHGHHFRLTFDLKRGALTSLELSDGEAWRPVLPPGGCVGLQAELPVCGVEVLEERSNALRWRVVQQSPEWEVVTEYELYPRGYIVGTWEMTALKEGAEPLFSKVLLPLDEEAVFSRKHRVINENPAAHLRQAVRGFSVNFSLDEREVTHSVDFLLESVTLDLSGKPLRRLSERGEGWRALGWRILGEWAYPFPKGYRYENRWCLTFQALDPRPNPVRGQRIYHWLGNQAEDFTPPLEEELLEMAEYGASIVVMHLPNLSHADTRAFRHPERMRQCVSRAHDLGMRVLVYTSPYLVARLPEVEPSMVDKRTECIKVWSAAAQEHQIVSYEPDLKRYDSDELNLRYEEAFRYVKGNTLRLHDEYHLDGLYVDYAWPAQGIAPDPTRGDKPGMFNFYDYHRMMREWREAIGSDRLMIAHGGGFLVGSDMVEGFDACLTGEAQGGLASEALGQQYGCAPTLWIIQRRKRDVFRSEQTIEACVREGLTPHLGICVHGQSVLATVDPGYFPGLIALWQMWRAFPMERATFWNHLGPKVVTLDNPEIVYSLYTTPEGAAMLLIANAGGPRQESAPAVGVGVELDLERLGLSGQLRCWRMKGDRYETFRIQEIAPVEGGRIAVPEIDHHEVIGFVLCAGEPPETLTRLERHLEGRFARLAPLLEKKQERMKRLDLAIDRWAELPHARRSLTYEEFMKGRVTE